MRQITVDPRFVALLRFAYKTGVNSHDPDTVTSAVLINREDSIIGLGANALPPGVKVTPERVNRPGKYMYLEHAERVAILAAARRGFATYGSTLIAPWYACAECARAIVFAGVTRVVGHKQAHDRTPDHWKASIAIGDEIMLEAGVQLLLYDGKVGNCTHKIDGVLWEP